jgi:hypothetical protein
VRYALLIYSPAQADDYAAALADPGDEVTSYIRELRDAGVLLAAEQLTHSDTATSVQVRGESRMLTDGPFMETKEHLLGLLLIEVPGRDAAVEWAARMPIAGYGTVEVRAVQTGQPWQALLA